NSLLHLLSDLMLQILHPKGIAGSNAHAGKTPDSGEILMCRRIRYHQSIQAAEEPLSAQPLYLIDWRRCHIHLRIHRSLVGQLVQSAESTQRIEIIPILNRMDRGVVALTVGLRASDDPDHVRG